MKTKRVLKWNVPINDRVHSIGDGPVLHVGVQDDDTLIPPDYLQVWTEADHGPANTARRVQVFATGQPVPFGWIHLGSVICFNGKLVWHVYGLPTDA